jgi:uncharacterized protein (TIGR02246 family)
MLTMCLLLLSGWQSSSQAIEKAVLETSAKMTQAGEARDVDRLFSFMLDTEKGSVIQNGKVLLSRSEALKEIKKNMSGISSIRYTWKQQHVTALSPTLALLISEGESSVTTEQGQSFTAPFAQTVVFVLSDGGWKAIHAHQSSPRR